MNQKTTTTTTKPIYTKKRTRSVKKRRTTSKQRFDKLVGLNSSSNRKEVKCLDFINATTAIVTYANVVGAATLATGLTQIFSPQQGTGFYNRIGNKTCIKSIKLDFDLDTADGVNTAAPTVRYLLIYDKFPNGAYPIYSDILKDLIQDGNAVTGFSVGLNMNNSKRFVILRDKYVALQPFLTDTSADGVNIHCKEYIKRELPNQFKGNTNPMTIADISEGALYFFVMSDTAAASNIGSFHCRVRYYDF